MLKLVYLQIFFFFLIELNESELSLVYDGTLIKVSIAKRSPISGLIHTKISHSIARSLPQLVSLVSNLVGHFLLRLTAISGS